MAKGVLKLTGKPVSEIIEKIKRMAAAQGISASQFVENILEEMIAEDEKQKVSKKSVSKIKP